MVFATKTDVHRFFRITVRSSGLVIHFTESDLRSDVDAEIIFHSLVRVLENASPRLVVIDFSEVRIFGSSLIRVLLRLRDRLVQAQSELSVCAMASLLREVLAVMRTDRLIPVHETADAAFDDLAIRTRNERLGRPSISKPVDRVVPSITDGTASCFASRGPNSCDRSERRKNA